jgi:protein-S-isoprenylcysteine O-methyltransferase Ste14
MTKPVPFAKAFADLMARLRVSFGFVLAALFVWLSSPAPVSLAIGLPIAACGLGLRAWAAGCVAKDQRLSTGGPYAYVRNPLYAGTLLAATGLIIASRSWLLAAVFAAAFLLMYLPVIKLEEQHLREIFPEYADYAARVPMLLPRGRRAAGDSRFNWSQWVRNREYQALAGFAVAIVLLAWKTWR